MCFLSHIIRTCTLQYDSIFAITFHQQILPATKLQENVTVATTGSEVFLCECVSNPKNWSIIIVEWSGFAWSSCGCYSTILWFAHDSVDLLVLLIYFSTLIGTDIESVQRVGLAFAHTSNKRANFTRGAHFHFKAQRISKQRIVNSQPGRQWQISSKVRKVATKLSDRVTLGNRRWNEHGLAHQLNRWYFCSIGFTRLDLDILLLMIESHGPWQHSVAGMASR